MPVFEVENISQTGYKTPQIVMLCLFIINEGDIFPL